MADSDGSARPAGGGSPTHRLVLFAVVAAVVLAPFATAPVAAEEPRFETTVPEPVVVPGQAQQLTFQLTNDAAAADERVETATDVEVTVKDGDTPIEVLSGPRPLGSLADGDARSVSVRIDVPSDIEPGTYQLPVEVRYENDGEERTATTTLTVQVRDRAYFRVDSVESDVAVGDTGDVTVTVTNVGTETAYASSLTLTSQSADLTFGKAASATRYVGAWEPNETRTLTYDVRASSQAETVAYALAAQVTYDTEGGATRQSRSLRIGVTPAPETTFDVSGVQTTLRVGEDGTLNGTVTNTGPRAVENVVLVFEPPTPKVDAVESEVAIGDLESGESVSFSFDVEVSEAAAAGDRQFDITVRYDNDAGERRRGEPQAVQVSIAGDRARFAVDTLSANLTAGSSGQLELELTNVGDEPLTDVSAKLYADAPLSSGDDEAFIESLNSGESVTLTFGLSVSGDAIDKTYPVKLDFRFETADGDTQISDTYQVPVEVTSAGGGGFQLSVPVIGAGLVAVLLVAGLVGYLRN